MSKIRDEVLETRDLDTPAVGGLDWIEAQRTPSLFAKINRLQACHQQC